MTPFLVTSGAVQIICNHQLFYLSLCLRLLYFVQCTYCFAAQFLFILILPGWWFWRS